MRARDQAARRRRLAREAAGEDQFSLAEKRRAKFVAELVGGPDNGQAFVPRCCAAAGVSPRTYNAWRERYPDWAAQVEAIRQKQKQDRDERRELHPREVNATEWDGSFADFRRVFLNRISSPWFHIMAVEMIERAEPGSITLFLWPPGHAKTSLIEDYITFKLATDPAYLVTVGSEKEAHARKVIGLIRQRLENDTPGFELMRRKFGPFAPVTGLAERAGAQPWGAGFFNVFKKPSGEDRDYSAAALGMGGSVIGTRTDLLIVDDPQSRKSLERTDDLVDIFRQDWLSRPMAGGSKGTPGKTAIIMNRVGEHDFPQKLIDEDLVDNVIRVRADQNPDPSQQWAWPEKYSPSDYEKMRKNVGEEAWARNFLQIARPPGMQTFTKQMVADCGNGLRSIIHDCPLDDGKTMHVEVACDPGYGVAAVTAAAFTQRKMYVLDTVSIPDLKSPEQIWDMIEMQTDQWTTPGRSVVTDILIESNAFQQGMLMDDRSQEMRRRWGVNVLPHQTRIDKNDPEIGVPQMAMAMRRREIDFPAMDEVSSKRFAMLYDQLYSYRAFVKGSKLTMDQVMTLWFLFRRYRAQKRVARTDTTAFDFTPLRRRIPA